MLIINFITAYLDFFVVVRATGLANFDDSSKMFTARLLKADLERCEFLLLLIPG